MTQQNTFEFSITGKNGVENRYLVIAHPPTEGMDILWMLMALGGEPLARLAQSVIADALQTAGEAGEKIVEFGPGGEVKASTGLSKIMDQVDLERVDFVSAARDLRMVIGQLAMTDLVHKLLKYSTRNGKPLRQDGPTGRINFDQAYTANYAEMLQAVGRVIAVNGFLPQFVTSMID